MKVSTGTVAPVENGLDHAAKRFKIAAVRQERFGRSGATNGAVKGAIAPERVYLSGSFTKQVGGVGAVKKPQYLAPPGFRAKVRDEPCGSDYIAMSNHAHGLTDPAA